MEKQRNKFGSKFSWRLLTLVVIALLSSAPLYAKFLTNSDVAQLHFSPASNQNFYTATDIKFEVVVPYVSSTDISVSAPVEMDNVSFKTLKRTDLGDEDAGTLIELWFSFSKKGTYALKPLNLRIQGFSRQIVFDPVTIKTNPKDQDPVIVLRFDDGTVISTESQTINSPAITMYAGKKIAFTLYFKYGVQLVNFNWEIPKDSIFTQVHEYEITQLKYKEKSFLEEEIPVSDFEWTALVPGQIPFPAISLLLTSNNGYKGEFKLPSFYVEVRPSEEEEVTESSSLFEQAFLSEEVKEVVSEKKAIGLNECEKLAELRIAERHSIFGFKRKARINMEREYGIPSEEKEFQVSNISLCIVLLVVSIFLFVFYLRKKKILVNIGTCSLIIFSLVILIICIVQSSKLHGVSKGCRLYAIPDKLAESQMDLQPGSYISIKEESGKWYYVQLGENGGWCTKEDIILIK